MHTRCLGLRSPSTAPSCLPPDKGTATRAPPVNRNPRALRTQQPQKGNPHERNRTSSAALPVPPHQEPLWHHTTEFRVLAPRVDTTSTYWCLRTMGPAGPDEHYVH